MSSIVLRSRILSSKCRSEIINRRVLSSGVDSSSSNSSRETIIASQAVLSDQSQVPPPPRPAPETAPQASGEKAWSILKYGLIAVVTGTAGYAGYLSYKCSYEEVDQKAKALRAAASFASGEDAHAPAVDKYRGLLYSAVMAVPCKAVESYLDLRRLVEENVSEFTEPTSDKLLPDLHPQEQHVFTLVLDLNETLLYTDWKRERGWHTFKRPGVDAFLEHLAKYYEIVVYSDQMNMYVDPVCERLDPNHCIRYRLSRGDTKYQNGKHYRDLLKLNRDPAKILYVSAHAFESSLQPENCVPIKPFKLEGEDTTLLDLIPFLEYIARNSPTDIRQVLQSYERKDIAKEFLERSKEYQRRKQEQRQQQGRFWRR
ncbi:Mitochondrial import inner membrane translocase subunit TIM50 [Hibiscus syriacus]|uniref:Mitochondrial import inner membrane translocase subunit TIM50 n=1 Tax=Hibiscus syriacus TaxID=106335 RepID=A0A6A2ZZ41_HIBSY|nr:mitochondrial import inner membrane translocase subunit TIM50-like [Hibiscus syriacus]KAE8696816.1 Mitochondrial import inner membrane translocase subunit TIM50 [Hibiscus syriacus]